MSAETEKLIAQARAVDVHYYTGTLTGSVREHNDDCPTCLSNALADALAAAEARADEAEAEVAAYRASMVAHHHIENLSDAAIAESLGSVCQICTRAQAKRRAALAADAEATP